jgi:hypothetical protein
MMKSHTTVRFFTVADITFFITAVAIRQVVFYSDKCNLSALFIFLVLMLAEYYPLQITRAFGARFLFHDNFSTEAILLANHSKITHLALVSFLPKMNFLFHLVSTVQLLLFHNNSIQ